MSIAHETIKPLFAAIVSASILAFAGLSQAQPFAYVANQGGNNVSVINTATDTLASSFTVGSSPQGVATDNIGQRVYVANSISNTVSVFDNLSNMVIATINVGANPRSVAVNPAGTKVYVTSSTGNNVSVIDTASNTVIATIPVGLAPREVAVNATGSRVYVANASSNNVSVIDATNNTVITTVGVGSNPYGVAINPAGTRVYVTNQNGNDVAVIDATNNTFLSGILVGSVPRGIAVNPGGTRAYVANSSSNSVSVIDLTNNTVVATVMVGTFPIGVAVNRASTKIYVANSGSNNVSIIDAFSNLLIGNLVGGSSPGAIAMGPILSPLAPTITSVTPGNGSASVAFSPPSNNGGSPITSYTAKSNPGNITVTGMTSPLVVSGLTNGTSYTFTVVATNVVGSSIASLVSSAVVPAGPPAAPTITSVTPSNGQATVLVTLNANNGSPITGYTVTSNPAGGFDNSAGMLFAGHTITGLTNGVAYTFTAVAFNAVGSSVPSAPSASVVPANVPGAPIIGTAIAGFAQATVSFAPPTNNGGSPITAFVVTSNPSGISEGGTASPITVTGLSIGVPYTFTVRAVNAIGFSVFSAPSNSVTPAGVPGFPVSVVATAGNASASVAFTAPNANGSAITGYTVTSNPGGIVATGLASPISVAGLTNGVAYTFTVVATNAIGPSSPSAPSNSVIPTVAPSVPDAPATVFAQAGNASAAVAFTLPSANGSPITGFTVTSNPGGVIATGVASPITVNGLTNGLAYTFTVIAINAIGSSVPSAPSNSVVPTTVPDAPIIGTATAGNAQASVSFTPPTSNGGLPITSYQVTTNPATSITTSSASPITVIGLTNGTTYSFTVKALNAAGASVPSAASNSVTPAGQPGIPLNVVATAGNASATVAFSAPSSNGGAPITIYIVRSNPGNFSASGSSSPITVNGLTNGTTYTFTVAAGNAVGQSPSSAPSNSVIPVGASGVPSAPANVLATPGNASATVAFSAPNANGSAITGYTVTSSPGGIIATGVSSPITVSGLTNGLAYTFTVVASNANGPSLPSFASNSVTPQPTVTLVPGGINFGSRTINTTSPPTRVTLTNNQTSSLAISSIVGSGDFGFVSTCPISSNTLAAASSCALDVTFTPLSAGARNGDIKITSNAPGSPSFIQLTGIGVAVAVPAISISPSSLTFGPQIVNTKSAAQSVTVTNTGFSNLILESIVVTPPFSRLALAETSPPNCGSSVAPGSSCQVAIVYEPTAIGTQSGQISIADNADGSPHIVALNGTATPLPVPVIKVNSSVAFGDQIVNSASTTQNITVANTGTATLTISAIALTGTNASNFTLTGQSGCASIAPSGSCTLAAGFLPTTTGAKTAQINYTSNAENAATVNTTTLSGNGVLAPRPIASLSPTAIGFGNVIIAGATPNQVVTLTNIGGQAMSIQRVDVTGDYLQTNNCGSVLAPLASCAINILFAPLGPGAMAGELVVTSNATSSPDRVQLGGTGCRWFSQSKSRLFLTVCGG